MLIFGSPSRYYQGPGCFDRLGEIVGPAPARVAVVTDAFVLSLLEPRLRATLAQAGHDPVVLPFAGDVTHAAIADLERSLREGPFAGRVDVVVGLGGGRAIDIAKGVAHRLGCPAITVPTAAANDAPTSKVYVVYDDHHALVDVGHLPANPVAVIADTAILASAPRALLVAGIGDAITKAFESAQCAAAGGRTLFGASSSLAAVALGRACYETVRARALDGLAVAGTGKPTAAFEELVEALFLMGGLGFESGGLSIAHAMTRGLSKVPGAAEAMHGQQVAYGLLVQLALEGRPEAFLADLRAFYAAVGLATSLAALGVETPGEADYHAIAAPTLAAPHARNFTRTLTEADLVDALRATERAGAPCLSPKGI